MFFWSKAQTLFDVWKNFSAGLKKFHFFLESPKNAFFFFQRARGVFCCSNHILGIFVPHVFFWNMYPSWWPNPTKNAGNAEKVEPEGSTPNYKTNSKPCPQEEMRGTWLWLWNPQEGNVRIIFPISFRAKQFAKWDFGERLPKKLVELQRFERRRFAAGKFLHGPTLWQKHGGLGSVLMYIDNIDMTQYTMMWFDMIW